MIQQWQEELIAIIACTDWKVQKINDSSIGMAGQAVLRWLKQDSSNNIHQCGDYAGVVTHESI